MRLTILRAMENTDLEHTKFEEPTVRLPTEKEKFVSFIFLMVGQMTSLFGSSIVMFAIIWWITVETKSAPILSIFSFLSFAPYLLLVPFTGVYADRWNKKKIIILMNF